MYKKTIIAIIAILIIGAIVFFAIVEKDNEVTKYGTYTDEQNRIKRCTTEKVQSPDGYGYSNIQQFFDENNVLIGNCSFYHGPGSSGCGKDYCSTDSLLTAPCQGSGCGVCTGVKWPKYSCNTN